MRVVIATDTLSPEVSAQQTATALARGWQAGAPHVQVSALALASGQPGTLELIEAALGGTRDVLMVSSATGTPQPVALLRTEDQSLWVDPSEAVGSLRSFGAATQIEGGAAVAPVATVTALALDSSSAGVGQILRSAAQQHRTGQVNVILSDLAPHDGGLGALAILGGAEGEIARILTGGARGAGDMGPEHDEALTEVLANALSAVAGTTLVAATTTDEPLFGLHGAHANLSRATGVEPQAGQDLEHVLGAAYARLERVLPAARARALNQRAQEQTGTLRGRPLPLAGQQRRRGTTPGSGAGGGVAALIELLGGRIEPAAEVVAAAVGLPDVLAGADVILTAVPVLDGGIMAFSVPSTVGQRALEHATPVIALAPEVRTSARELAPLGIVATYALGTRRRGRLRSAPEAQDILAQAEQQAQRLARTWTPAERS